MVNFSQVKSGRLSGIGSTKGEAKQMKSQRRDIVPIFLSVLSIAALILMVTIGSLNLLKAALLQAKMRIVGLPESVAWLMQWQNGLIVIASLSLVFVISVALTRWRVLKNRALWPAAGCPLCQEQALIRIPRSKSDRFVIWSGRPVRRYKCNNCFWVGRRIFRGSQHATPADGKASSQEPVNDAIEQTGEAPVVSLTEEHKGDTFWQFNQVPNFTNVLYGANEPCQAMTDNSVEMVTEMFGNVPAVISGTNSTSTPTVTLASTDLLTPFEKASFDDETFEVSTELGSDVLDEVDAYSAESARVIAPFHVNLRRDPRSDAEVLNLLEPGTEVALLGKLEQNDGIIWRQVRVGKQGGWLVNAFLQPHK